MIVDDQRSMRMIVRQLLHQSDIDNVIEAENGLDAMEKLADSFEKTPDIIICDLYMDKMDGMEFVHQLRRRKNLVPVLILTGEKDSFVREVTAQAGATKVLTKPISAPDLLKEIQQAVGFA